MNSTQIYRYFWVWKFQGLRIWSITLITDRNGWNFGHQGYNMYTCGYFWRWTCRTLKRSKVLRIHVTNAPESQISLHFARLFSSYMPFETSAPNGPQMTLKTKRSKVPHIHVITTPGSQFSLRFAPRPGIFEFQVILILMTPKWPWTLKVKGTPYTCNNYPGVPGFSPFHGIFFLQAILRQVHRMIAQNEH